MSTSVSVTIDNNGVIRVAAPGPQGTRGDTGADGPAGPAWSGGDLGAGFISWSDGSGVPATSGKLRFPAPASGALNVYPMLTARCVDGTHTLADLNVAQLIENPSTWHSLQLGDPGFFNVITVGGVNGYVAMSTDVVAGGVSRSYFGIRGPDGLAFLNTGQLGQPLSKMFERSDAIAADFAIRDEYSWNGTTVIRFGPSVQRAQGRFYDGGIDRVIWDAQTGTVRFGDAALGNAYLLGLIAYLGSAAYGAFADQSQGYSALRANGAPLIQAQYAVVSQRVAVLAAVTALTPTQMPAGSGDGVVYVAKAQSAPTVPPSEGFIIYVDPADDKLKSMGKNGTITPLANP